MSAQDPLKNLIQDLESPTDGKTSEERSRDISKKISSAQSKSDFAEFGLVKIWTVLLEMFSVFYVRTQDHKSNIQNIDFKNKENNRQESK